jgi:flagellar basal-body rod modification protein FlgD
VQLATFSGVEQQVKTNEILGVLSGQLALSGLADLAGWVGKEARAPMAVRFDGAPITLSPNPAATADTVELVVRDAGGAERWSAAPAGFLGAHRMVGTTPDGTPRPPDSTASKW